MNALPYLKGWTVQDEEDDEELLAAQGEESPGSWWGAEGGWPGGPQNRGTAAVQCGDLLQELANSGFSHVNVQ